MEFIVGNGPFAHDEQMLNFFNFFERSVIEALRGASVEERVNA